MIVGEKNVHLKTKQCRKFVEDKRRKKRDCIV